MCIQLSYYFLFGCTTDSVKYQAQPQIIYTSTKSEESFLSALQRSGMLSLVMTYELSTCVSFLLFILMQMGLPRPPLWSLLKVQYSAMNKLGTGIKGTIKYIIKLLFHVIWSWKKVWSSTNYSFCKDVQNSWYSLFLLVSWYCGEMVEDTKSIIFPITFLSQNIGYDASLVDDSLPLLFLFFGL